MAFSASIGSSFSTLGAGIVPPRVYYFVVFGFLTLVYVPGGGGAPAKGNGGFGFTAAGSEAPTFGNAGGVGSFYLFYGLLFYFLILSLADNPA